ncbi:class I SAM-dependent methyltransferase [Streptomyces sp. NBC_01750]|uniref:class I SAM-dependent methyltransferase n=1 Tax=Streptomyces sp. NBC_01750 TaxID=2975928 RepID=UPI002DDAC7CE|nr:class I SAM-dependent methyltransferase [Streptomyces sp. NBC_01750]WSD30516.1 class I SAM-dependent methyltransferase [Streptomyces sp. NBC_01750]WSD37546.1 class I SAM-dependent methyltransferase [Streptomyces sp. NBC_01750]
MEGTHTVAHQGNFGTHPGGQERRRQSGRGDGPIARDGSPVALYTRLAPQGEAEIVSSAVLVPSRILELGCGAGRVTRALASLGHEVVAVDESRDMLDGFPALNVLSPVEKIHSSIEGLRLAASSFDGVVLASQLINTINVVARKSMLDTCRHHVRPGGSIVIQRHDPSFLRDPIDRRAGKNRFIVRDIEQCPDNVVGGVLEYHVDGHIWTQQIWVQKLSDDDLAECLRDSSLRLEEFLTSDRTWLRATPI